MAGKYDSYALLAQLGNEVLQLLTTVSELNRLDEIKLNHQPAPGKWSIAQIIEHLNTYNRYYLPLVASGLSSARRVSGNSQFRAGWLGNYFTKSMYSEVMTGKKVANKMSAMKGHIPEVSLNAAEVIREFIKDQQKLLQLLNDMKHVDMASVKIPITISRLIKISIGDALRFLVAHQVRHQLQIAHTVEAVTSLPLAVG